MTQMLTTMNKYSASIPSEAPVKKRKWTMKIVLFPLIFFAFANIYAESFADALIFSVWGFPFYWFVEKAKKSKNQAAWRRRSEYSRMFGNRTAGSDIFEGDMRYQPSYNEQASGHNSHSVPDSVYQPSYYEAASFHNSNSFHDSSCQTPHYYGLSGFDVAGNYTGSDTAIGGISS
jgi:hypothetical protein